MVSNPPLRYPGSVDSILPSKTRAQLVCIVVKREHVIATPLLTAAVGTL